MPTLTRVNDDSAFRPESYGAKGDGSTNDTVAFQAAIDAAKAVAGKVVLRNKTYIIDTLDLTAITGGLTMQGDSTAGARLRFRNSTPAVIIDGTGSSHLRFYNLWIEALTDKHATVGVLFGRNGVGSSQHHVLDNVVISGYFDIACLAEVTSEANEFYGTILENYSAVAGSVAYVRTNTVELGLTSTYETLTAFDGNTEGAWFGGAWVHTVAGHYAAWLRGIQEFSANGTGVATNAGAADVLLMGNCNSVAFRSCHMEGSPDIAIYHGSAHSMIGLTVEACYLGGTVAGYYGFNGSTLQSANFLSNHCGCTTQVNADTLLDSTIDCQGAGVATRTAAKRNRFWNVAAGFLTLVGESGNVRHEDLTAAGGELLISDRFALTGTQQILGGAVDPSAGAGVVAPQGSVYLRTNGGAVTTLYVKTGAGDTDWTAK